MTARYTEMSPKVTEVGEPGTVADGPTVAGADATDGSLVPTLFVAVTVKV
ncbi:unannotated protein [freshwater metagenome]|uniref:Unannotated protein n=1 Tax=freshwater metagenome TaxID=449393 RepID=A0A6J5YHT2_9ZZZZ